MNCKKTQALMVEYADGVLDAAQRAQVQGHLAACSECAGLSREITETRGLLRALPPRQTSAQFEARLTARLAQGRRPMSEGTWGQRLAACLRMPPRVLRPAFALCAAAGAVAAVVLYPTPAHIPPTVMISPTVSESALVSQCVAQHQSAAAAQPLSDPAAQNLTANLGASATPPPTDAAVVEDNF